MRLTSILFTVIATASFSLAACSSGDDGGGDDGNDIDANTGDIDAAESPDAPTGNTVTGLGEACDQANACPTEAALCADLDAPADMGGFCTLSCGMSPENPGGDPTPPAGGDAMCAAAYTGTSGTPVCALYTAAQAGQHTWYCAVMCAAPTDCATGLTCQNQICDD
jgi:hypothetical protein